MLFRCFLIFYLLFGLGMFFIARWFFAERASLAVRCSCSTAASIKSISVYKKRGRRYMLDYYDAKGTHYVVSYCTRFFNLRWGLNYVIPIYYNTCNPMEICVPDCGSAGLTPHSFCFLIGFGYFIVGVSVCLIRFVFLL